MAIVLFVALGACLPFAADIYLVIAKPIMDTLPEGAKLIAIGVATPLLVPFKATAYVVIIGLMPYLLYELWAFVRPGLYRRERRSIGPLLIASVSLFYGGIAFFSALVLPSMLAFFRLASPDGIELATDIGAYLDFVAGVGMAFGMVFQMPVIIHTLIARGVVHITSARKARRYVIVGCFALGMLLTPPDILSQILMAVPMIILYELGLLTGSLAQPKTVEDEEDSA